MALGRDSFSGIGCLGLDVDRLLMASLSLNSFTICSIFILWEVVYGVLKMIDRFRCTKLIFPLYYIVRNK